MASSRLARFIQSTIRMYQHSVSPLFPSRCRFAPSCSEYAIEALDRHGLVKALAKSAWRILRCNPFSSGGVDHP